MPITRNTSQDKISLEEFYGELVSSGEKFGDKNDFNIRVGKGMIRFIEMINETFKETQLWGLTSLIRLIIQKENDWKSDWYVIISGGADENYKIEYLIPENKRPWKNAMVHGEANNLDEAKKYLIIAMNECGGWKDNDELEKLIRELEKK
jgi:hypothetical protein